MTVRVVSFTGLAGAGKTTAAGYLREAHWFASTKPSSNVSFADPLRELCLRMFPWVDPVYFTGDKVKKETPIPGMPDGWSGRRILQHLGTEGFRAIDPDIWVKLLEHRLCNLEPELVLVTIDDVRFPNEAVCARKFGPLVRIRRPGLSPLTHASERHAEHLQVDHEIVNDGSLSDLYRAVAALFHTL